jgi:hypothetical protein
MILSVSESINLNQKRECPDQDLNCVPPISTRQNSYSFSQLSEYMIQCASRLYKALQTKEEILIKFCIHSTMLQEYPRNNYA